MKAETEVDICTSSSQSDLTLQIPDKCQSYERRQTNNSNCLYPAEKGKEYSGENEKSVSEHFENTVRKYGDRLALKFGTHALTYNELNQASNRIGRRILENRGRESEPIALLFERGIDAITAIFGTLKTGKFYVALDPNFPAQRNA